MTTGSLFNMIMEGDTVQEITVGMGATYLMWTDRHAATVVDIFTKGKSTYIVTQQDTAKRVDNLGMSDQQEWEFERNPDAGKRTWKVTDKGFQKVEWNEKTKRFNNLGKVGGLAVGYRSEYYDFSF